ncbi:MAG: HAMP domain-containing histidine kinase [Bacteroidales bacterium]|nr:HAMP domain-containing histidine kinase [Bacteroidales bacterium]
MNIYQKKMIWKLLLLTSAVVIAAGSLVYTNRLVEQIKKEERKKIEQWAEATRLVVSEEDDDILNFLVSIIDDNTTVPVILTDGSGNIISTLNLDTARVSDSRYLEHQLDKMKESGEVIPFSFGDDEKNYIHYRESTILRRLIYYPYIQLGIIMLFIAVAYFAFSMARSAEQNQVWVGMSRETAHQLGTPTSSLAAWTELLRQKLPGNTIPDEISKDVGRLEKIADRFSKIGSRPALKVSDINDIIEGTMQYLQPRLGDGIEIKFDKTINTDLIIPVNRSLFEWVLENLCRNAADAMSGKGIITITTGKQSGHITIDICDRGRGIPKRAWKTIFKPGYTTKERGWGLGLSLAARIIEEYHRGKIFVNSSDQEKGSCFRIVLPRNKEQA